MKHRDGWTSFKEAARSKPTLQAGIQAVEAALALLHEKFGPDLDSVLLFGSFARGSIYYDDIDLLIITSHPLGTSHEVIQRLSQEIFGPLFLNYGQLFSFQVYGRDQFRRIKDHLLFLPGLIKEAIILYGENPLI